MHAAKAAADAKRRMVSKPHKAAIAGAAAEDWRAAAAGATAAADAAASLVAEKGSEAEAAEAEAAKAQQEAEAFEIVTKGLEDVDAATRRYEHLRRKCVEAFRKSELVCGLSAFRHLANTMNRSCALVPRPLGDMCKPLGGSHSKRGHC